jgi:hypothetical protein
MVHHCVHQSPPPVPILSHVSPLHTPLGSLPKIHFGSIFTFARRSSEWSLSTTNFYTFLCCSMRATCSAHHILLDLLYLMVRSFVD